MALKGIILVASVVVDKRNTECSISGTDIEFHIWYLSTLIYSNGNNTRLSDLQVDLANKRKFTTDDIRTFAEENNFLHFMETSVRNNVNVEESMR